MRRNSQASDTIGGADSFLDIVANLVGILIILVVVVGAQAKSAHQNSVPSSGLESELSEKQEQLESTLGLVDRMTLDNRQLEADVRREQAATKSLADERHAKLMRLEMVKQELAKRSSDWDEHRKAEFERQVTIDRLKSQLTDVENRIGAWSVEDVTRRETIEHFPTPIAKTVFTEEIHFRLSDGKISFVPMQPLVEQMRSEWKVVAENLANSQRSKETVGPIDGYRLQYVLKKAQVFRKTEAGRVRGEVVQLDHFTVVPASQGIGEVVTNRLFDESRFLQRISEQDPARTTISVWVYPDSYEEFQVLKTWLRQQGFQIASWPLDHGRPISGGPNGFKTSAQ